MLFKFTFLSLLILINCSNAWYFEKNDQICAQLFVYKDENGDSLKILHGGRIPNLGDYSYEPITTVTSENENEAEGSISEEEMIPDNSEIVIEVQNNCKLVVCNDTSLVGTCAEVSKNVTMAELAQTEFGLASAYCSCPKVCSCEDIQLRRTECARAYIDKRCNDCDAPYADMREGSHKSFPNAFRDKITSFIVRDGCQLTTYDEEDFKGTTKTFKTKVTKNLEYDVGSYKCSCSAVPTSTTNSAINVTRPSHYPPMVEVPKTSRQVNALLNSRKDRHPGLIAALQSLKNRRSSRHAYILLLGLTGAGKSSTINFLFDNPTVAKPGDANSTTTDIHEYQIPIPVDELGISNSELRVIDTPGLVDTRGLEQDAKFLATLHKYLENHEDLRRNVPNVVLVFAKFNDNRFSGDGASFVKMLRAIDVFREKIMPKKFSNVIIVLTHYMSETNAIVKNPAKRLADIRKVVEEFSQFPKPIVMAVAENKPHEESLTMVNGFYRLPNGDYYPRNLFEKIQSVTTGTDPIGEAIIRTAFKNPDAFVVKQKKFELVGESNSKFLHYLGIIGDTHANSGSTEISELLQEGYENLDGELKRLYPDTLDYLQRALFNRRILTKQSLPSTTPEIAKFFTEIRTNPAILKLLDSALSLSVPFFPEDYLAGKSYNLVKDESESLSPFHLENMQPTTDIGFTLPDVLSCSLQNSVRTIFQNYNSKEEYLNARLGELRVGGAIKPENFNGKIKAGRNVVTSTDVSSALKLSALIEYQTFQLTLTDNAELSERFLTAVRNLEKINFDSTNFDSVQAWTAFFTNFGSHVVQSAYGGGSLEIKLEFTGNSTEGNLIQVREDLLGAMYSIVRLVEDSMIGRTGNANSSDILQETPSDIKLSMKFRGGDYKHHLANISHSEATDILEDWRESIALQPVMLENGVTLLPISEVVKRYRKDLNSTFYETMEKAASALLNSSLAYTGPVQTRSRGAAAAPVGREGTTLMTFDPSGSSDTMEQFLSMFKALTEESKAAQQRFQDMWEKMHANQIEREERIRKETEEQMRIEKQERQETEIRLRAEMEAEKDRQLQRELASQLQHLEELKIMEAERAAQRETARENQLIAQQQMSKQQEMLLAFVSQQNEQVAALQKASIENRSPSLLSEIGGVVKSAFSSIGPMLPLMAMG